MKIFGLKSMLLVAIGLIGVAKITANSHTTFKDNAILYGGLYIALCFISLRIIIVTPNKIKVLSINPFIKKIDMKLSEIKCITIKTSTFAGVTTINIQSANSNLNRSGYLLKWEQNKLANLLESYNVNVENYRM